ncbi:hypothetical protein [Thalassovita sp.]|uniref:hypothetical protein n=1 Tax=Thalassovita sp. TaxID=1979401 RepID=UPI002B278297|nr:hypothetical protein [Thalassovita sp.]
MLEIHDTLQGDHGWDIVAVHMAVDEVMESSRLSYPYLGDDDWSAGRILYSECIVTDGDEVVGAGRLIWDAERDNAIPRIQDFCLMRAYRSSFVVDSMISALIDGYAEDAAGGTTILSHDGQEIDISERVERLRDIAAGQFEPRVI